MQFNDLHVLDLDGKSWAPVAAIGTPPSPRTGHATLAVHDDTGVKVVVLGGCSQTEGCVRDTPLPHAPLMRSLVLANVRQRCCQRDTSPLPKGPQTVSPMLGEYNRLAWPTS